MMKNYTIYCTEEQTRKALELGAPIKIIEKCSKLFNSVILKENEEYYTLAMTPTAEQMINWLEEQKIFVHIAPCVDINCSWHIATKGYNKYGYVSNIMVCKSRMEATLAAIDAALEYLTNKNK